MFKSLPQVSAMTQDGRPEAPCGQGRCKRDSACSCSLRPNIDALPLTFARKVTAASWAQRVTADHQAQPRREHLEPRGEAHGSCRDLALHGYGRMVPAPRHVVPRAR